MPSMGELLSGPFLGLDIYPRAAVVRARFGVLLLLGVIGVAGALLAGAFQFGMNSQIDGLRDSQLWLMPRVNVADGIARVESAPGRTLDAGPFWMVLDTTIEQLDSLPGERADRRSVVHISRTALVVYKRDRRVATGYPWSGVESSLGSLSLDGPELVDFLHEYLARLVVFLWMVGFAAVAAWQMFLIFLFVGLYRSLFFRGLYVPRFGTLVTVASLAALPAIVLCTGLLVAGVEQMTVVAVHALLSGALFFVAATRVRLGDERPDLVPPDDVAAVVPQGPLPAAPDIATSLATPEDGGQNAPAAEAPSEEVAEPDASAD